MPKIQNSFLRGKMNKDLDERLVPKGEYREAQNILITQSESSDVGAIENIQGNALAVPMPTIVGNMETIGYYADNLGKKVFWFITDFTGDDGDIRTMSRAQSTNTCQILMADLNNTSEEAKIIVQGHFLNFSKNHLITGINLIDDLLFFTDNYNQPRKINVTKAIADNTYYTKEEQISVAKVSPFLAPILKDNSGNGDAVTLQNDETINSDYLKDKFVRFSYRYKYEDGEYTVMAPFTQIVFKPLNEGHINNVITSDLDKSDVQDVYSKTVVDIMKNNYNKIDIRIPLPGENYQTNPDANWDNYLNVSKIEILIKESDQDVVKVIKEIDVNNNASFTDLVETMTITNDVAQEFYYRHVYKFTYKSEKPYKILEDKQITRVFDQVPLRAKSQEISGNRIIYGNFTENYNLPVDDNGKTGINYVIKNITKGGSDSLSFRQENKKVYKYNSVKQRREYQVGIILSDIFGRQSTVILSKNNTDTTKSPAVTTDFSENYNNGYSWSNNEEVFGKSLSIMFTENDIVNSVYNGDITSDDYNPYGWYSYKIVVKQQEQEYYNVYTNHPADNWNNDSNTHDDILGFTWISLYGNNINKVPRDVDETDEVREGVAGSDTLLFPKVIKRFVDDETLGPIYNNANNLSMLGSDRDPVEVMTIGTAREQAILTKEDRDKDRVHDFVMSKRNPLLAQVKSIGSKNRTRYIIPVKAVENNNDDRTILKIGNGDTINPYIRAGQEITIPPIGGLRENKHTSNIGKKIIEVQIENSQQENFPELDSKTIMTNGKEISTDRGDSAMMRVGQFIEFLEGDDTGGEVKAPLYVDGSGGTLSSGSNSLKIKGQAGADIRDFLFEPFGLNNMSFLSNIAQGKQVSVSTEGNVDGFSTTVATLITTSSITLGTGEITPGDNTIYTFVFSPSTDADIPENTQITFVLSNTNIVTGNSTTHKRFLSESNTTATIVEHGDDFNVRRPILQKVELNDNSKKTIMHFDRSVIPFTANHDSGIRQMMALFDPLTIKSVETITEVEDGVTKYYQKIKLSHEHEFEANDDIIIQNLEEEPIAVNTGLTVLETQPVESNLDIYYESSTSGLIRDLHTDFISQSKELEISYYNTFILSGGANLIYSTTENDFVPVEDIGQWHVEESRVKGEYNGKSVDFGVKAYLVDTNYAQRTRGNALIHSGIFNAKTDVNETNQFSIGESITKAVDIQNGSIQKLYAEDTNLIIFQENKVSRALIDKDIIFTQEGQPLTTASKIVIGQVGAFAGDYGISNNPESFAVHAGRKYFSDKNRGVILRLSQDGLTPISDAGMRSFFRDNLQNADRIYGMYDEQKNKYVVSMQNNHGVASTYLPEYGTSTDATTETRDTYATLSFDEGSRGWVSFYTYKPTFGFSIDNKFYTYNLQNLYEHYRDDVQRCMFYKSVYTDPANIEFVFNDEPTTVKNFHTINYEGTSGWKMASSETDMHEAYPILSSDTSVSSLSIPINFVNKENKYYGHVRNNTTTTSLNQITGIDLSGVKGYFNKVKMQYWKPSEAIASSVNKGELYAVGSETVYSSQ
jgi:hypothetical protein